MRLVNHIVLDFEKSNNRYQPNYWLTSFLNQQSSSVSIFKNKFFYNNYINTNNLSSQTNSKLNTSLNLLNVNFLRREFLYTKLKYSRSPAYDIVSGGAAAIFAGFLGFLVSEKFGLELVDSGDFYFLIMYIVFLCFSVRPLLITMDKDKNLLTSFSLKPIFNFYITLLLLFCRI